MNLANAGGRDDVRTRARVELDAIRAERDAIAAPGTVVSVPSSPSPGAGAEAHVDGNEDRVVKKVVEKAAWPNPLRAAAYHGVIGEIVRALEPQTEADPAAILVQLLVMFGSLIGRTAHFRVEADIHHLNQFTVLVGETAKGRKGVSGAHARQIGRLVDPVWAEQCNKSGLSSGEGLIWAIRDPIEVQQAVKERGRVVDYQTVVEDPGISDKRLLIVEEEFAMTLRVIGRDGNTLSALVRQAWDGHDLRALTKNSPAKATAPHISIVGHITKDELRRYLTATESANGFGNRFLWVCAKRSKLLPDGGVALDLAVQMPKFKAAVEAARHVQELRRDPAARRLWHHEYPRLSAGRPGLLGAMTGRAEAQVMRLACLYALLDRSPVVGLPHLQAALEVWRYCFDSACYIFGSSLGDPVADAILSALRAAPNGLTRRDLTHDVLGRNRSADELNRALALLHEGHVARHEEDRTGGGRPAERWFACDGDDQSENYDQRPPSHKELVVKVVGSSPNTTILTVPLDGEF